MKIQEEYKKKLVSAEEAVKVIKSGDLIDWSSFNGQPVVLDQALAARKENLTTFTFASQVLGLSREGNVSTSSITPAYECYERNHDRNSAIYPGCFS